MGITNAFLCSFYRVATLGSGAGVAAIVYLGEHGIEYSRSFGMYMLQYAFHKISIAFFSMILFALNWNYMRVHFGEYMWLLLSCNADHHRGFNSVQLFQAVSPHVALGGGFLQWKDERAV